MNIKRIKFKNRLGYPMDMVLDIVEEERSFIFAKSLENGNPFLINKKKDLISVEEAVVAPIKK